MILWEEIRALDRAGLLVAGRPPRWRTLAAGAGWLALALLAAAGAEERAR